MNQSDNNIISKRPELDSKFKILHASFKIRSAFEGGCIINIRDRVTAKN